MNENREKVYRQVRKERKREEMNECLGEEMREKQNWK